MYLFWDSSPDVWLMTVEVENTGAGCILKSRKTGW